MVGEETEEEPESGIDRFLKRYFRDAEAGRVLSLWEYLRLFPGHDREITEEYFALNSDASQTSAESKNSGENPERFGNYVIERELGRGGQGIVYLARDLKLGRHVALKVLHRAEALDDRVRSRFRREAEVLSRLDHPGLCTVYESGTSGDTMYIGMRYVDGETLARRLQRTGFSKTEDPFFAPAESTEATSLHRTGISTREDPKSTPHTLPSHSVIVEMTKIVESAARALHAAHEVGVIHRDVKPGNIMITKDGSAVILDFGLARKVDSQDQSVSGRGIPIGTPSYMSREQLLGNHVPIDRRTDIYSLGVSLYEAISGVRPFRGPTPDAIYQQILTTALPSVDLENKLVPSDLALVVATATEPDPNLRYATALDFAEDLARALRREPIRARPIPGYARLWSTVRRHKVLSSAIAGSLLILTTLLAILWGVNSRLRSKTAEVELFAHLGRARGLLEAVSQLLPARPEVVTRPGGMDDWLRAVALHRTESSLRSEFVVKDPFSLQAASHLEDRLQELASKEVEIRSRREFTLDAASRLESQDAELWGVAIAAITSHDPSNPYLGFISQLKPQLGLIPLRRDPRSKLYEFLVLGTGDAPKIEDGLYKVTEATGIVLVLLPGGTFRMGTKVPLATSPEYHLDKDVTLAPFFLSKYELTQGVYMRLRGVNPSAATPEKKKNDVHSLAHPVEMISRLVALDAGLRLGTGLDLPTEAQWEFACRAGTTGPYYFNIEDAIKYENLLDQSLRSEDGGRAQIHAMPYDDKFPHHAPVGSFQPNAFGLYDMAGNVSELCLDPKVLKPQDLPRDPKTGRILAEGQGEFVCRGGSWYQNASYAQSYAMMSAQPDQRSDEIGVRFARSVDP